MKPIRFSCQINMPLSGPEIGAQIADMANWSDFPGYSFLPSIEKAHYEIRTESMVGSRIQVSNSDGSTHVEEIYHWQPQTAIGMKLHEFSPPLKHIASHFNENWTFKPQGKETYVIRSFELYPKSVLTKPFLWLISLMFRKAIQRHLEFMKAQALVLK